MVAFLADTFSQFYLPGAVALWCSLGLLLTALWGYALALNETPKAGSTSVHLPFARRAYGLSALALGLTCLVFALCLVRRDFRIEYVFQYSGLELPIHFQFAAFWAGQKGSFLIWLLWSTLLGVLVARTCGKKLEAPVMLVYSLTVLGLMLILVRENPFVMLGDAPVDGKGLNPLLQDDWMVIHPPIMFIGYALSAVPFAFAIAALWKRDYRDWATRAFPWALAGFLVLGAAILMGGYWAYKTLGWGGYWGWDPVENASLIPWLLITVLIHGLYMERTRNRYRRGNLIIACLTYMSVLYGTFLTRSGVLADFSVHSFVDLGISGLLILQMAFFGGLSAVLLALRLRGVPTAPNTDPVLSRGSFMVLGTLVVLTSAIVVTVGTSAPLITSLGEFSAQVGPEWYNRVNFPLALLVASLLIGVPFLSWRETSKEELGGKILMACGVGLAGAALSFLLGVRGLHLLMVLLAVAALTSNLQKVVQMARSGSAARIGGYLTHVGVGIMLLGFLASSAYDHSTKVTLQQGSATQVGDLTLTFTGLVPRNDNHRERMEVRVEKAGGDIYYSYPQMFTNDRTGQLMARPHIRKMMTGDLYISPLEYRPQRAPNPWVQAELRPGEETQVGSTTFRLVGFDAPDDAATQLAANTGASIAVRAVLEMRDGSGEAQRVMPQFLVNPVTQQAQTPVLPLANGGRVVFGNLNPTEEIATLAFAGFGVQDPGAAARLSLDVTRKPLIKLVWYGLYVVLAGGLLAMAYRLRQVRRLDEREEAQATA